jgi:hypothetical protein
MYRIYREAASNLAQVSVGSTAKRLENLAQAAFADYAAPNRLFRT